tara:strand:+ start:313 stop:984 length:672 start_codon:yes stop_codon:yes gene_type:complete
MRTLIIGPHPDDEIIGCGGFILKSIKEGNDVGWCLITKISDQNIWSSEKINKKLMEIEQSRKGLSIKKENFYKLNYEATQLDNIPLAEIVKSIKKVIDKFKPTDLLIPNPSDIHSDHLITFKAAISSSKSFRSKSIKRILIYETISETEFAMDPRYNRFEPNLFVNISDFIQKKLDLLDIYKSEFGEFPFPRSKEVIEIKAKLNGSRIGVNAAEAFQMIFQSE